MIERTFHRLLSNSSLRTAFSSQLDNGVVETCSHDIDTTKLLRRFSYHVVDKEKEECTAREGERVIRLDLARLSRAELEQTVTECCSQFGTVIAVVIVQDSANYDFALASVEMSTRIEAMELLRRLGESMVDDVVVIRLEQRRDAP